MTFSINGVGRTFYFYGNGYKAAGNAHENYTVQGVKVTISIVSAQFGDETSA